MGKRRCTAKLLKAARRDSLPIFARDLELAPKFTTSDDEALPLAHLAPGADPVTLAIIEFYRCMHWQLHSSVGSDGRRRPNYSRLTIGEKAMEQAFSDLLRWLFANENEREYLLVSWIGAKYIKDWPDEAEDPAVRGPKFYERVPVTMRWVDFRRQEEVKRHA